jgi:hypothetical protein
MVPAVRLEPPTHIENAQVIDNIKGLIRQKRLKRSMWIRGGYAALYGQLLRYGKRFSGKLSAYTSALSLQGSPHFPWKNRLLPRTKRQSLTRKLKPALAWTSVFARSAFALWKSASNTAGSQTGAIGPPSPESPRQEHFSIGANAFASRPRRAHRISRALVWDVSPQEPRVAGEARGFQSRDRDEHGTGEESWRAKVPRFPSCEVAIAACLWNATPYPVEITAGQGFGEAHGNH